MHTHTCARTHTQTHKLSRALAWSSLSTLHICRHHLYYYYTTCTTSTTLLWYKTTRHHTHLTQLGALSPELWHPTISSTWHFYSTNLPRLLALPAVQSTEVNVRYVATGSHKWEIWGSICERCMNGFDRINAKFVGAVLGRMAICRSIVVPCIWKNGHSRARDAPHRLRSRMGWRVISSWFTRINIHSIALCVVRATSRSHSYASTPSRALEVRGHNVRASTSEHTSPFFRPHPT